MKWKPILHITYANVHKFTSALNMSLTLFDAEVRKLLQILFPALTRLVWSLNIDSQDRSLTAKKINKKTTTTLSLSLKMLYKNVSIEVRSKYSTCLPVVVDKSILFGFYKKLQYHLSIKELCLNDLIQQKCYVQFNVYFNVL